jgi:hypothetical protein
MLRKLLLRDWILHRNGLIIVMAIFAAFQVYFVLEVSGPRPWLVFTAVYIAFLTIFPFTRDDKFRSTAWSCTLPVSRAELVRARWLAAWLIVATGFAIGILLAAVLPGSRLFAALLADPEALLLAGAVVTVVLLMLLPFTIRFGILGVMIGLVGFQLLGAGAFVAAKLTGGLDGVEGGVAGAFRPLIDGILGARTSLGVPGFALAALAVLFLLNWAGYRLSVTLFRRQEL